MTKEQTIQIITGENQEPVGQFTVTETRKEGEDTILTLNPENDEAKKIAEKLNAASASTQSNPQKT